MEEKKGYVEHIIYRNQENGYTVFEFVSQEEGEEYLDTCVGTFPFINEGEYLTLYGDMVTHPTYHEQFKVQKSESCSRMTRVTPIVVLKLDGVASTLYLTDRISRSKNFVLVLP